MKLLEKLMLKEVIARNYILAVPIEIEKYKKDDASRKKEEEKKAVEALAPILKALKSELIKVTKSYTYSPYGDKGWDLEVSQTAPRYRHDSYFATIELYTKKVDNTQYGVVGVQLRINKAGSIFYGITYEPNPSDLNTYPEAKMKPFYSIEEIEHGITVILAKKLDKKKKKA